MNCGTKPKAILLTLISSLEGVILIALRYIKSSLYQVDKENFHL